MKLLSLATAFIATTTAAPSNILKPRKTEPVNFINLNELEDSDICRPNILIYARGSTEKGNMGFATDVGPATCNRLKSDLGGSNVACQGIGPPYYADLTGNMYATDGTTELAYGEGLRMFRLAHAKCPGSKVVGVGYSQGAAVITAAIRRLDEAAKVGIVAVAMYGDTRSDQEHGKIPNYPWEQVLAICESGDGVCDGDFDLRLTEAHHRYLRDVGTATEFLEEWIERAGGGGGKEEGKDCMEEGCT